MKVGHVTERQGEIQGASMLDSDEMDRAGIDLGATGRLQLMAKLAEGRALEWFPYHEKYPGTFLSFCLHFKLNNSCRHRFPDT